MLTKQKKTKSVLSVPVRIPSESPFWNAVHARLQSSGKSRLFGNAVRHLTTREVSTLKTQGNRAQDWKKLWVTQSFKSDHIRDSSFFGTCVLGLFTGRDKLIDTQMAHPTGIYRTTLFNCEIGDECLLVEVKACANYIIDNHALLFNVGRMTCSKACTFGNGIEISPGAETGGRETRIIADLTIPELYAVVSRRNDHTLLQKHADRVTRYLESCTFDYGFIGSAAIIRTTALITDSCIGPLTLIDNAAEISNSTIISSTDRQTSIASGAIVRNTCVQEGCTVDSYGVVENSLLCESARVVRHAKVMNSAIGPNTEIAEGEVNHSLLGPCIGFHHQSLLIAALWPQGRGNVGHGANVGSNHTGRLADQELHAAEGIFFGLGCNIKFPANLSQAPYTLFATSVVALPQRLMFPFSLINHPSKTIETISTACNEISPGWLLLDNAYALRRAEFKFNSRYTAKRTAILATLMRNDLIQLSIRARDALRAVKQKRPVYTEADIPGIGRNFLLEARRLRGIEAYTFYIELYALQGLLMRCTILTRHKTAITEKSLLSPQNLNEDLADRLAIYESEGLSRTSFKKNLERLIDLQDELARAVCHSLQRDELLGKTIFEDYTDVHASSENDPVVERALADAAATRKQVHTLLTKRL